MRLLGVGLPTRAYRCRHRQRLQGCLFIGSPSSIHQHCLQGLGVLAMLESFGCTCCFAAYICTAGYKPASLLASKHDPLPAGFLVISDVVQVRWRCRQ